MDLSTRRRARAALVLLAVVALPASAQTEEPPVAVATDAGEKPVQHGAGHQELSDLGILNFFSEGWNEKWVHRHRYTPDMALLKVTTNFLEQEFRLDYANTQIANNATLVASDFLNGLIAYALNRRFMLEIIANYQWNIKKSGSPANGAGGGFLVRFQLVDNPTQSYDFQVRVSPPNRPIGQTQTSMQYSLSGWQDMHALIPALGRFGLYYSFTYENLLGPLPKAGARSNDISYDISLAETWTSSETPVVGNFTTFVEFFGTTDLDGTSTTPTVISVTPGIRFWFVPKNSLTFGVELPLVSTPPFNIIYRLTYILNF
jgi:hypothetical protein